MFKANAHAFPFDTFFLGGRLGREGGGIGAEHKLSAV